MPSGGDQRRPAAPPAVYKSVLGRARKVTLVTFLAARHCSKIIMIEGGREGRAHMQIDREETRTRFPVSPARNARGGGDEDGISRAAGR